MPKALKAQIDGTKVPRHVAMIMDGNGRWAKAKGKPRIFGHKNGVQSVREAIESAGDLGVEYLTLYAFSTENWKRPAFEVNALMTLLVETLRNEIRTLKDNNIRLLAIGDLSQLPKKSNRALMEAIEQTSSNDGNHVVLALNYSGRWDITRALQLIAEKVKNNQLDPEDITSDVIKEHLSTKDIPDPELLIRTSGEFRISNFLLWEIAYAELFFSPVMWPEFRKQHFYQAIIDYQTRERRFGKTGAQISVAK